MAILIPAALVVVALLVWVNLTHVAWQHKLYANCLGAPALLTLLVDAFYPTTAGNWRPIFYYLPLAITGIIALVGFMEYVVLRLLALVHFGALVRVTYYEVLLQPFTLVILSLTVLIIIICTAVPYYTFDEDNKMFRDVATQFSLLAALAIMVFAASKVVDEEIENRTMLTLMSKPISRWQVLVGKYVGILCVLFLVLGTLAILTPNASYLHWLDDKRIDLNMGGSPAERAQLSLEALKNTLALAPLFTLQFLQVATLAAICVAISTRYSLAVNVTVTVVIYMAANLAAFIPAAWTGGPGGIFISFLTHLLPNLSNFDISQRLIYGDFQLLSSESLRFMVFPAPTYGQIWAYTGLVGVYSLFYIGAALALAMVLFRTRELS